MIVLTKRFYYISLCVALDWVGSKCFNLRWVGSSWVIENGPMDNCEQRFLTTDVCTFRVLSFVHS